MSKFIAVVKIEGMLKTIECAYKTKKEFKEELKNNGFVVKNIYTEIQYKALDYATFSKDVFNKELLEQIIKEYNL